MSIPVRTKDGKAYKSMKDCARANNISDATVRAVMKAQRVSRQEAFSIAVDRAKKKRITDKSGHSFRSLRAACRAHGVRHEYILRYMRLGKSFDEAVRLVIANRSRFTVIDKDGKEYASFKSMCKAYGVPYQATLALRRKIGGDSIKAVDMALRKLLEKEAQI